MNFWLLKNISKCCLTLLIRLSFIHSPSIIKIISYFVVLFNDISLTRYDIWLCRMIYLLRKHDIISVPSYAEGIYHPPKVDIISKIYHPFHKERISLKKVPFVSRQKGLFSGDPYGNRTHDSTLRGWRLSRLTNGPSISVY